MTGGEGPAPAEVRAGRGPLWPWLPPLLYMGLIFALSSLESPLPDLTARFWDKSLHALEYGGLAALLVWALRSSGAGARAASLAAVATASLYGATDELHQAFVPGRSCDPRDWMADTVGAALGAALASVALRAWWARASMRPAPRRTRWP